MGALRPQGLQKFVPAGADYSHPLAWRARCMGQQQGCEGGGRRDLPKSRSELSVESGAGVGGCVQSWFLRSLTSRGLQALRFAG